MLVIVLIVVAILLGLVGMLGFGSEMAVFGLIIIVFARIIQAAEYQKQAVEIMTELAKR